MIITAYSIIFECSEMYGRKNEKLEKKRKKIVEVKGRGKWKLKLKG